MDADSSAGWKFQWDEAKNRANIRKHGFDFVDAEKMFRSLLIVDSDGHEEYGESRWVGIGAIGGRVAYVVFTRRNPETIRIISLRKASHSERKEYEKAVQNRLETD